MEILLSLIRIFWLIMIVQGLAYIARKHLKLNYEFLPIFTISSMIMILFLGGLCDILFPVTCILAAAGTACSVYSIFFDYRKNGITFHIPIPLALVFVGFLLFAALLRHTELIHYDNFTHWATVVKEMLLTNSFPTAESVMVTFSNYPLGTSTWLYFVCIIAGHTHGIMLVAQALLIFSCFGAIFGIIQERRRVLLHLILGLGLSILSFFNIFIRLNNLLVDFLLPVLAVAIIAVIYSYRKHIAKAYLVVTPMLGLLMVVKSTGLLFAAIAMGYLVFTTFKFYTSNAGEFVVGDKKTDATKSDEQKLWVQLLCCLGLSLLPLLLWNYHVDVVFAGVDHKFDVEVTQMFSGFGGKSIAEVQIIVTSFLSTFADFSLRPTIGLWAFEVFAIVACIVGCGILQKEWFLPKLLVLCNMVLFLYYCGILAMYIYSMPLDESIYLAGYERYASSIVVWFGGILAMGLTSDVERSFHYRLGEVEDYKSFKSIQTKKIYNNCCVGCFIVLFLILSSEYSGTAFVNDIFQTSLPAKIQSIAGDHWGEVDDSEYLLFAPDTDSQVSSYYLHHVAKYYLWANNVDAISTFDADEIPDLLPQYDYLIVVETDSDQEEFMETHFGVSGDIGIYDASELLAQFQP